VLIVIVISYRLVCCIINIGSQLLICGLADA